MSSNNNEAYDEISYNNNTSINQMNASALVMRLDTKGIIEDLELFLRGLVKHVKKDKETGEETLEFVPIAEPLANPKGIHCILATISTLFNSSNVQGNFKEDQYNGFIKEFHSEFAKDLMINLDNWGVSEDDYSFIVNRIIQTVIPFLTRLIDNKERESYESTIKTVENNTVQNNKRGLFG